MDFKYLDRIPCPFIYAKGRPCTGRVVRVEGYHAQLEWRQEPDGSWRFAAAPQTHYHLFCSEKNDHSGAMRPDALKFRYNELSQELRAVVDSFSVAGGDEQEQEKGAGHSDP